MKLVMMRGIPGSGKSTYARQLVEQGYVRVNKDDIRTMFGAEYSHPLEAIVHDLCIEAVTLLLQQGRSVVVDNTNMRSRDKRYWHDLAWEYGAEFEVVEMDTPLEECLARDAQRPKPVGEEVIRNFAKRFNRGQA